MHNYEKIIYKAQRGDEQAFSELYEESHRLAFYIAHKLVFDRDAVLDIVQDSYVKVYKNLDRLEDPSNYTAWLGQIVSNTAKDYLKKNKPLLFSEIEDDRNISFDFEDERDRAKPDHLAHIEESDKILSQILYSLPSEQRLIVTMFYFNQLTTKEISENLSISENTVKSRLRYARIKIKNDVEKLEKQGIKLYNLAPLPLLLTLYDASYKNFKIASQYKEIVLKKTLNHISFKNFKTTTNQPKSSKTVRGFPKKSSLKFIKGKKLLVSLTSAAILLPSANYLYQEVRYDNLLNTELVAKDADFFEVLELSKKTTYDLENQVLKIVYSEYGENAFKKDVDTKVQYIEHVSYQEYSHPKKFHYLKKPEFNASIALLDLSFMGFLFTQEEIRYNNDVLWRKDLNRLSFQDNKPKTKNLSYSQFIKEFNPKKHLFLINPDLNLEPKDYKMDKIKNKVILTMTLPSSNKLDLDPILAQEIFDGVKGEIELSLHINHHAQIDYLKANIKPHSDYIDFMNRNLTFSYEIFFQH